MKSTIVTRQKMYKISDELYSKVTLSDTNIQEFLKMPKRGFYFAYKLNVVMKQCKQIVELSTARLKLLDQVLIDTEQDGWVEHLRKKWIKEHIYYKLGLQEIIIAESLARQNFYPLNCRFWVF